MRKLANYAAKRNDPNAGAVSNLSPYLHFGQLYIGRIIAELGNKYENHINDFIDEVLVRKELSDNYCFYNKKYDNFAGLPTWAQNTLNKHRHDKREYMYTRTQFEKAQTHDNAWNAAQLELFSTGKMHGYMRMYWAKKILEWSSSPEEAIDTAIYLNDKYSLDGKDPNGYVGVLWSIGGLHDRPWFEREVYGMVRYMNDSGLKRKFDIEEYIKKVTSETLASLVH
jgi:deoxyribodipyrimidine photo-lyase